MKENEFQKFFKEHYSAKAKKATYDTYEGGEGGNNDSNAQPHKPIKPTKKPKATAKSLKGIDLTAVFKSTGGAPFKILIEKAIISDTSEGENLPDKLILEGLATTTNVDYDKERMAPEAIKAMEECINDRGVPLLSEHDKGWDSYLGRVFKAEVDERNQLKIWMELDKNMSKAVDLYKALKRGAQLGLSVAGVVKRAAFEMAEGLGRKVKTFYDVALNEVSVTNRPSNFDTWLIAKGNFKGKKGGLYERYVGTDLYQEYLSANPAFDWRCAIAKSITEKTLEVGLSKKSKNTQKNIMTLKDVETKALEIATKAIKKAISDMSSTTEEETTETKCEEKAVDDTSTANGTDETTETTEVKDKDGSSTADTSEYVPDTESSSEKEASAKKALPVKPAKKESTDSEDSDTADEEEDESSDSSESTGSESKSGSSDSEASESTGSTKKSVKTETIGAEVVQKFREKLEEEMKKSGMRLVGNVSNEFLKSFLETPKEKKGKAIVVTKNFNGEDGGEEKKAEEEVAKDLKDPKVGFRDFFKKNYGTKID